MTINAFAATAVASAAPGPGGLPVRVVRNQLQYCSLICPFVLQGAATMPDDRNGAAHVHRCAAVLGVACAGRGRGGGISDGTRPSGGGPDHHQ